MGQHSRLPPSAAHRWMNCPGSVTLIGDEPNQAGQPAMMGTAAHKVVETMLVNGETNAQAYHNWNILVYAPGTEETRLLPPGSEVPIAEGWHLFICDDVMVAGVQMMIDEVERVRGDLFAPELFTERYLDMSWLDPRLGGTADVTLLEPGFWIHLLDYKNGRVVVEVKDNEQMMNYAVGLLHEHPDAQGVTVHLVQPNAIHEDGHVRTQTFAADELKLFEIQMKEAADATAMPNAPRRCGDWCTYCPGKVRCPEFDQMALREMTMDFAADPVTSPPEPVHALSTAFADDDGAAYRADLARRAKWIPAIKAYAADIAKAIFAEMMNGRPVPGYKLVQGKSNRAYIHDAATTRAALIEAGLPEDQLDTAPELKSPAQVEKIRPPGVKAKHVKDIVAGLAFRPPGKLSVAEESDARAAVEPAAAAAADFAGDDPNDTGEDFG